MWGITEASTLKRVLERRDSDISFERAYARFFRVPLSTKTTRIRASPFVTLAGKSHHRKADRREYRLLSSSTTSGLENLLSMLLS